MRGILFLAGLAVTGCTTQPPVTRTAEAEAQFQKLTSGKVAGQPMTCLPTYRSGNMVTIDDQTVVFEDGRRVYVNHLLGDCPQLSSGFYTLVTNSYGSGLCRGDIAKVVDLHTGMTLGACAIGDFTPYTPG